MKEKEKIYVSFRNHKCEPFGYATINQEKFERIMQILNEKDKGEK